MSNRLDPDKMSGLIWVQSVSNGCLSRQELKTWQMCRLICRAGRYYRGTGISQYFISVICIVIQFGRIVIFSSIFIVTISCWNLS